MQLLAQRDGLIAHQVVISPYSFTINLRGLIGQGRTSLHEITRVFLIFLDHLQNLIPNLLGDGKGCRPSGGVSAIHIIPGHESSTLTLRPNVSDCVLPSSRELYWVRVLQQLGRVLPERVFCCFRPSSKIFNAPSQSLRLQVLLLLLLLLHLSLVLLMLVLLLLLLLLLLLVVLVVFLVSLVLLSIMLLLLLPHGKI